jgi:SSS family solute:Na+ symporter
VLAAALSALMSTSSGALIACSTVTTSDLLAKFRGTSRAEDAEDSEADVNRNRLTTLLLGILAIGIAMAVTDVLNALTIAYNVLVGGLAVAIVAALFWKRGTREGALASMITGTVAVIAWMAIDGIAANSPIYWGLGTSLVVYVVVSLLTPRTPEPVLAVWTSRLNGSAADEEEAVNA